MSTTDGGNLMTPQQKGELPPERVHLPAPTVWPMILGFGLTLAFFGLVTNIGVTVAGLILFVRASVGWWFDVLPMEQHVEVPLEGEVEVVAMTTHVHRLSIGEAGHRVRIPAEIKPYSSGIKGGLAGAVAMAVVAVIFGIISQGSIWYPINLLAATAMPSLAAASIAELRQFHAMGLLFGSVVHLTASVLVGVLYAVTLPMFPKRAWLWAGIITPFLWSGLIAATLDGVNPAMKERIEWGWFMASQLAFGMIGGYVIARSQSIETMQTWPLAMRTGIEATGIEPSRGEKDKGARE
jgi:hypothetical protein